MFIDAKANGTRSPLGGSMFIDAKTNRIRPPLGGPCL
jgi:hypothetical protein